MKKIFFIILLSSFSSLVFSQVKLKKDVLIQSNYVELHRVITIEKPDFLTYVYNFEKNPTKWVYEGSLPCIIDFYADWCGPCRMIAPILEQLAMEYEDKIVIYKVNTEKSRDLSQIFQIRSLPTLLFCPLGENPQAVSGAMSKDQFKEIIEKILLKNSDYQ